MHVRAVLCGDLEESSSGSHKISDPQQLSG